MLIIFEENENGKLSVQVNKNTGRIYGFFYDYPVFAYNDIGSNVEIVKLDVTIEEFAKEFDKGLFYKNGYFIRPVRLEQQNYHLFVGSELSAKIILPEVPPEPEFCTAELKNSEGVSLAYTTFTCITDKATFSLLPQFEEENLSSLKLLVTTVNYGTASATVLPVTQQQIDKARIRVEAFNRAIPDEEILNTDSMSTTVRELTNINLEDFAKIMEANNDNDTETVLKLMKSQLNLAKKTKDSFLNKMLNFIKGDKNE